MEARRGGGGMILWTVGGRGKERRGEVMGGGGVGGEVRCVFVFVCVCGGGRR